MVGEVWHMSFNFIHQCGFAFSTWVRYWPGILLGDEHGRTVGDAWSVWSMMGDWEEGKEEAMLGEAWQGMCECSSGRLEAAVVVVVAGSCPDRWLLITLRAADCTILFEIFTSGKVYGTMRGWTRCVQERLGLSGCISALQTSVEIRYGNNRASCTTIIMLQSKVE